MVTASLEVIMQGKQNKLGAHHDGKRLFRSN